VRKAKLNKPSVKTDTKPKPTTGERDIPSPVDDVRDLSDLINWSREACRNTQATEALKQTDRISVSLVEQTRCSVY